ncbi:unnamed protein product, partial [Cylicocyclus nassatus]
MRVLEYEEESKPSLFNQPTILSSCFQPYYNMLQSTPVNMLHCKRSCLWSTLLLDSVLSDRIIPTTESK